MKVGEKFTSQAFCRTLLQAPTERPTNRRLLELMDWGGSSFIDRNDRFVAGHRCRKHFAGIDA